jgi:hypothetical protein
MAGHLLECGSQVTGGYFADPGVKDIPDDALGMATLGFPIAEIGADGAVLITKPAGTGGRVDRRSVTEQLLYELHDPGAYLTPDVVMDITGVTIAEEAPDRVRLHGARGLRAAGAPEGHGQPARWLAGRGRDFLCRPQCARPCRTGRPYLAGAVAAAGAGRPIPPRSDRRRQRLRR